MKKITLFVGAYFAAAALLAQSPTPAPTPATAPAANPVPATAAPNFQTTQNAAYLAASCANCHGSTGNAQGSLTSLAGLPAAYLTEQMQAFKSGKRPATVMHQIAKGYSDAQIAAISSYFAAQKRQ